MTVIKINVLTVPKEGGQELAKRFAARLGAVDNQDGFEGFELLEPSDDRNEWLVITRWRDEDAFAAWVTSSAFGRSHTEVANPGPSSPTVATRSELWSYKVSLSSPGESGH